MMRLAMLALFPILLLGCSSTDKIDTETAEGAFALGEKYEKDERYEEALVQFNQVKNKHPYSRFAVEAKMRIADIHFKREDWLEAQNAYQVFKEMHPKHPRSDFITYRLALCFFNQLPSTIDRDLSLSDKAILYFDEVVQSYPSSEFVKDARSNRTRTIEMLAEKEDYIGNFYFIRDQFDSALGRYEGLLEMYPDTPLTARALYRAAVSAHKIQDNSKARSYYRRLMASFPRSDEAVNLKRELSHELK